MLENLGQNTLNILRVLAWLLATGGIFNANYNDLSPFVQIFLNLAKNKLKKKTTRYNKNKYTTPYSILRLPKVQLPNLELAMETKCSAAVAVVTIGLTLLEWGDQPLEKSETLWIYIQSLWEIWKFGDDQSGAWIYTTGRTVSNDFKICCSPLNSKEPWPKRKQTKMCWNYTLVVRIVALLGGKYDMRL